jgi:hypothetical protein
MGDSRQLNVHPSGRVFSVVEVGVVVQLETGLHAVVVVKLNECKATALVLGVILVGSNTDCGRRVLFKVLGQGLLVGRVRKVACSFY